MTQGLRPTSDPIFTGLFVDPQSRPAGTACEDEDGEVRRGILRPYEPVEESALAAAAAESALVSDALTVAQWVGEGCTPGPDGRLQPADAEEIAAKLSLLDPTEAQVLWSAAIHANLIQLDDGTARVGDEVQVWEGPAAPQTQLDSWGRLLVGLIRARADLKLEEDAVGGVELLSTPLYYALARDPMPSALPAYILASAMFDDPDDVPDLDPVWMIRQLPAALDTLAGDWAWSGVLGPVQSLSSEQIRALDEMMDALVGEDPDPTEPLTRLLGSLMETVHESPMVQLTALGAYGLRRILLAHGWQVPLVGAVADVSPDELLDLLLAYPPEDLEAAMTIWLQARADQWERALQRVATTARSKKPDQGPDRRMVLGALLRHIGPQVAPLLDALATDPWLSALVADARFELDLGPEPTLAEELWLIVDSISVALDSDDQEKVEAVEDSEILEFLRLPGALEAAQTLTHPHTRYVLRLVVEVSGDKELAQQLRRVVESGPIRPGKGRAKRRR